MDEENYIEWVRAHWGRQEDLSGHRLSEDPVYLSACFMGEAAEAWDVIKKPHRDGRALNAGEEWNLLLELGDAYHYLTRLADRYGLSMDEVRAGNYKKLMERYYPDEQ